MQVIKEIDQDLVKFIAAGEKINDIETAIRELVENSIDAEAKNIEIRLSRFGVDCIEVVDDGVGINEENFKTLGVRYHTSKITNFAKLQESLSTFGFRGEALSCLINIANVTITTKTKSSPTGSKLIFQRDGTLGKVEPVARSKGTTVILKNLFYSLPVRKRELEMTAKRQYDKVVKLMYEQLLARPHIKFTLCKKSAAKKEKDFTHGGTTLEGCIVTIFGLKVLDSLMPIKQPWIRGSHNQESCDNSESKDDENKKKSIEKMVNLEINESLGEKVLKLKGEFEPTTAPVREDFFKNRRKSIFKREKPDYLIHGYISKIGRGRNSTDCQFIFVNKKPCDISQISRLINEVYRGYSPSQYPFFCLFIQVQQWAADFNVPRKRAVILQEENRLYDIVKESLDSMFSPLVQSNHKSCPVAHIPVASQVLKDGDNTKASSTTKKRVLELDKDDEIEAQPTKKQVIEEIEPTSNSENQDLSDKATTTKTTEESRKDPDVVEVTSDNDPISIPSGSYPTSTSSNCGSSGTSLPPSSPSTKITDGADTEISDTGSKYFDATSAPSRTTSQAAIPEKTPAGFKSALEVLQDENEKPVPHGLEICCAPPLLECRFSQIKKSCDGRLQVYIDNPEDLSLALEREREQRKPLADSKEYNFAIHPNFNVVAEQELKFNLDRSSFESMQIIGQFNKGFIITRLNKHLFIIDQHATDERANYENQLDKYPLIKQPMVVPKPLYLNSIQENIIINHIDAFKLRGFEFDVDESKVAGLRVRLASTSICKGHGLDDQYLTKEDVEELIDVISNSPNSLSTYALKKVRYVAASRACRSSVMIGDKLSRPQMAEIVSKMTSLQNPWVCAHNRPTIRHLMDTDWMNE